MESLELDGLTFQGEPVDRAYTELLARVPAELGALLEQLNGFIAYGGGLHIRGICHEPAWHSLAQAWDGPSAIHRLFPEALATDVPFGQDCLGDQFLLRDGTVHRLVAETGRLKSLDLGFWDFFRAVQAHPEEYLAMQPLMAFWDEGKGLEPGQLLSVFPPYAFKPPEGGRSMRAIPALEQVAVLADVSRQLRHVPDGTAVQFKIARTPKH